jgi:hypothetical protein
MTGETIGPTQALSVGQVRERHDRKGLLLGFQGGIGALKRAHFGPCSYWQRVSLVGQVAPHGRTS